jgi:hypothetical protein
VNRFENIVHTDSYRYNMTLKDTNQVYFRHLSSTIILHSEWRC